MARNLSAVLNDMNRIERRYNPEVDLIPDGPLVTWAEFELMTAVNVLIFHVQELEERIKEIEHPSIEIVPSTNVIIEEETAQEHMQEMESLRSAGHF